MLNIDLLLQKVGPFYDNDDPGHDMAHIRRVMKTAARLAALENADNEVVLAAAALHDIVNLPKNHPERLSASTMAAARGREILKSLNADEEFCGKVSSVIREHSYSLGAKPTTVESAIVQDADKLDALGAIGIMRTVTCGCRMGAAYYDIEEPHAQTRALDDKSFTLDHFYVKLFRLPELMNTRAAKAEAEKRVAFMKIFIEQLNSEIV